MATVITIILALALISFFLVLLDDMFYPLYDWIEGAILEIDEDSLSDYLDNSEYDWGHNVKNYIEEEL